MIGGSVFDTPYAVSAVSCGGLLQKGAIRVSSNQSGQVDKAVTPARASPGPFGEYVLAPNRICDPNRC
jgi:hypothetical protein